MLNCLELKETQSKEPITVDMLTAMVESVGPDPSLSDGGQVVGKVFDIICWISEV